MSQIIAIVWILSTVGIVNVGASLLDQLNFYASQNYYEPAQMLQAPFSLENVMGTSLELALQSCQDSFRWQRWNCPSTDFFLRRTSKPLLLDREDAYVTAITTAAILYTITKNCSSGILADCGCNDNTITARCSDDPQKAEELYHKHVNVGFSSDFYSSVRKHNHNVVTTLLRNSLVKQCGCATMGPTGCIEEVCLSALKPFAEIANDILQMYNNGLQLGNAGANSQVIWKNVPLDSLVFTKDSPNFCEPDAVPHWNGVRGRQCSMASGDQVSAEESSSCLNLCHACGYRVRTQNVITERRCNCQLTWGFQIQCDMCMSAVLQFYCY